LTSHSGEDGRERRIGEAVLAGVKEAKMNKYHRAEGWPAPEYRYPGYLLF